MTGERTKNRLKEREKEIKRHREMVSEGERKIQENGKGGHKR